MRILVLCACLLLCSGFSGSDSFGQRVNWKADLETLVTELKDRHPNPFSVVKEADFDRKAAELAKRIDSLDRNDATFELMELVALLGDGHTAVRPDFASFRIFPINVKWFEDGIYVRAIERKHKELVGAKLVAVGDVPAEKIVERFAKFMSHDNLWGVRKRIDKQFQNAEFLERAGLLDDANTVTFHFEKDSKPFSVTMKAVGTKDAKRVRMVNPYAAGLMKESVFLSLLIKDEQGMPFWNEWIKDQKLLYFKYNQCRNAKTFGELVDGTAGFIAENDVQKFVLDLRDNAGGSSLVFKPLLDYLLSNDAINQKGKLFVIVGRDTFSSGIFAACDMRETNAIFVGEPTSSKPNHFGEVKTFQLPSSGLTVEHSSKYFVLVDDDPETFEPDIKIQLSAKDVFGARDQALQAIFDYEEGEK
ncbi:hypothetical protein N9Y42_04360 [Mariniblastus sp.]|nr:hypothetical protein [Mariniblastus sp.]